MSDLREALRCLSEAQGQLRSMVRNGRPDNARNRKAILRWIDRARLEMVNREP